MNNEKKLANFEREYYAEINNYAVTERDLIDQKINPKYLSYEVFLRKNFGDFLSNAKAIDDFDSHAKRSVEKLSKDKLDNSELANIMTEIESSEFDDNLDTIIHSKR